MQTPIHQWLDDEIPVDIAFPQKTQPKALLIALHGLLGYRRSSKFLQIEEEGIEKGFIVVRFDQTGAGENRQKSNVDLISARLECVERVIEFSYSIVTFQGFSPTLPLFLFGSSFGGYLAYLYASKHFDVTGIVSWATPYDVKMIRRFLLENSPFSFLKGAKDPLGYPDSLDVLEKLQKINNVMIVHGTKDEIVPWFDAYRIYNKVGLPKRLLLMEDADHRFSKNSIRKVAIKQTFKWFDKFL